MAALHAHAQIHRFAQDIDFSERQPETGTASLDDESESEISSRAEATLRMHYSRGLSGNSSGGGPTTKKVVPTTSHDCPYAPDFKKPAPRSKSRSDGSHHKAAPSRPSETSQHHHHKATVSRPDTSSFFEKLKQQSAAKGVYRTHISDDSHNGESSTHRTDHQSKKSQQEKMVEALQKIGLDKETSEHAAKAILEEAEDSASFSRHHALNPEDVYSANICPICEETLTFAFHEAKSKVGHVKGVDSVMNANQARRARLKRMMSARATLSGQDQVLHDALYRVEVLLRTEVDDERIFRLLLRLRRSWVERRMEYFEIDYVAWTLPMIRAHYDVRNNHFKQPDRENALEHDIMKDTYEQLHGAMKETDPTDGTEKINPKIVELLFKASKELREQRKEQRELRETMDPEVSSSLRQLASAISATEIDCNTTALTSDPDTAAGTIKTTEDARATAASVNSGRNNPAGLYATCYASGF